MTRTSIIRTVFAAGVIFYLLASVSISESWVALRACNPLDILSALALITCSRILMPLKFNLLLSIQGIPIKTFDNLKIYYLASFAGLALPATLGADAVRIYCLKTRGCKVRESAPAVLIERFIGLAVTIFFGCLGALIISLGSKALHFPGLTSADGMMVFVLTILLGASFCLLLVGRLSSRGMEGQPGSIIWRLTDYFKSNLTKYKGASKKVPLFTLLTGVEAILSYSAAYFVIKSLNVAVPIWYVFAFLPVQFLILRLPVSIAGWGIPQLGFVYFLTQVGVPSPTALIAGVLHQLLLILGVLPGLFPFLSEFGRFRLPALGATIEG